MPLADDLAGYFADHPLVELAFLFGSVGDGRAGFASDLDVAVMSGRAPLLGQVLHEGTRLYCESNARYAELIKRHMFDQADWRPYRERILRERRQRWIGNS
ncbi:MAG: hypothetical protein BRD57_02465 [Proteobacteria bacterium SW_6_67_9]|nr:MAG: hypothetical protein BRD57_02465 [Proteobacteria bacterium SW_6_67_9]